MLEIHRIKSDKDIYFAKAWKLYLDAFPEIERRSLQDHLDALDDESFCCTCYIENNEVQAILFYWDLPTFAFIEFFAIDENQRGKGLGSKILQDFSSKIEKRFVLEIEEIIDDNTERRWQFYKKLGFCKNAGIYHHPPYQAGFSSFPLIILSYLTPLSEEEYNLFINVEKKKQLVYTFTKGE